MRSSPTLAETRFNLRFFLTTPAKNPRIECCCQPVAFMIAAIVVPFGCRSIPSTVSFLVEARVDLGDGSLGGVTLDGLVALNSVVRRPFVGGRDCLVMRFTGLDLGLLVAIWPS